MPHQGLASLHVMLSQSVTHGGGPHRRQAVHISVPLAPGYMEITYHNSHSGQHHAGPTHWMPLVYMEFQGSLTACGCSACCCAESNASVTVEGPTIRAAMPASDLTDPAFDPTFTSHKQNPHISPHIQILVLTAQMMSTRPFTHAPHLTDPATTGNSQKAP